jgi:hypothetical protein
MYKAITIKPSYRIDTDDILKHYRVSIFSFPLQ